jgi:tetratricopeptide (TPR) repeat protein
MVGRPPFTNQLEHDAHLEALDRRLASLEADLTPEALEEAARRYVSALAERPGDTALRENLARLQHRRGLHAEAAREWRRIIERIPNHGEAFLQRALALTMDGRHEEAAAPFARGLELVPHQARLAHNDMGNALEAVGRLEEAIDRFRQALRHDPDFAEAHYNLAGALRSRNRIEEAIDHYRQAVRLEPDFPVAHYDLACVLQAEGRTDPAIEHYRKALEGAPGDADTHYNLANALLSRRDLDEAIDHYRRAIQLRPGLAQARINLGGGLAMQGRLEEAIEQFREVLRLDPDSASGLDNLSRALTLSGRSSEALAPLRHWMRLDPGAARPREQAAWILATHRDPEVRSPDEAIRLAEQAAALTNGQDPAVLDTLAAAYAAAGRFDEAVPAARRALELAKASSHRRTGEIRRRLALYERRRPFRDGGPGAIP